MKTLFLMVGMSGSGKSVMSKSLSEKLQIPRHSSDEIRGELCNGDMTDQSKNGLVFQTLHARVENDLIVGSVIADATNVKSADRKTFRQIALRKGAQVVAVVMNTDLGDCKKYNASRDRIVPDWVIDKQWNSYSVPTLDEVTEVWYANWSAEMVSIQRPNRIDFELYTFDEIYTYGRELSKV